MAEETQPQISPSSGEPPAKKEKSKARSRDKDLLATKRRCVSTACIACRRRKSKCDGNTPSCAACASVYGTECVYDPNSDHRRKGVYKKDIDSLKTRNTTLQTLIQGILNYPESEIFDLVTKIRTCENLEDVADEILARSATLKDEDDDIDEDMEEGSFSPGPTFERELAGKMGELRLENGSVKFIGGTSNLLYYNPELYMQDTPSSPSQIETYQLREDAIKSWTSVATDSELVVHLLNMYFTWHYPYFTTLSRSLFFRDFFLGKPGPHDRRLEYCTPLLVNAMLALGCHFTGWSAARENPTDPMTAGDHFFKEAKRLIMENDEFENPRLATVQALALMSVREAGCGREARGWVYSGMSFRIAYDLGLNIDPGNSSLDENYVDARRVTFWGCFLFDKCWSNYLGRPPQLPLSNITTPKFDVFPEEDAENWSPWTDEGLKDLNTQPSRTRAIALQISALCEISSDLLLTFYRPVHLEKPLSKQAEVKKLSDFHTRLEAWKKNLPREMEPKEGQLPNVLVMHMFYHLLFIHLFRPFLKYTRTNSPLPSHVSPRKICTQSAAFISKLLRLYKRTHGLRQIVNIAVYIIHSACTIHLLNLPDKDARRDIAHGVRQLEEIAEGWPCAHKTLLTLSTQVRQWNVDIPEDTRKVLARFEETYKTSGPQSPYDKDSPMIEQVQKIVNRRAVPIPSNNEISSATTYSVPMVMPNLVQTSVIPDTIKQNRPLQAPNSIATTMQNVQTLQSIVGSDASRLASETPRAATSTIFGGLDTLFEDSKDWWLRDQSTIFDTWPRRESVAGSRPSMPNLPASGGSMDSVVEDSGIFTSDSPLTSDGPMNGPGPDQDIGYLDFGAGTFRYGFNGQNDPINSIRGFQ